VDTIEKVPEYLDTAKRRLREQKNVRFHLGHSPEILASILPDMSGEIKLFYLDAHWYDYLPLLEEIEVIGKYLYDRSIIVIDDIFVPNRNHKYLTHRGTRVDFDFVKNALRKAYSDYVYYYLNSSGKKSGPPRIGFQRRDRKGRVIGTGKMYVFPKNVFDEYNIAEDELFFVEDGVPYSNL
jgi:hypothetical protein